MVFALVLIIGTGIALMVSGFHLLKKERESFMSRKKSRMGSNRR